ncbi:MAG: hypothetical protein ACRDLD_02435 [Thermoleophilaceae bacterium]
MSEGQDKRLGDVESALFGWDRRSGVVGRQERNSERIERLEDRLDEIKLEQERRMSAIYRMLATTALTLVAGTLGIIGTLLITAGSA